MMTHVEAESNLSQNCSSCFKWDRRQCELEIKDYYCMYAEGVDLSALVINSEEYTGKDVLLKDLID